MRKISDFPDTHDYGFEVPPLSRERLTNDANRLQRMVGYDGKGAFPIAKFIEMVLPRLFDDFSLEILPRKKLGEKLGETLPDRHVIRLREDVYDAMVEGQPFARMTGAHEVGHLFEHEGIPIAMARREATRSMPRYRSSEWQANAFAGELLMPSSKIIVMSEGEIVDKYNVTKTAAATQLHAILSRSGEWELPCL